MSNWLKYVLIGTGVLVLWYFWESIESTAENIVDEIMSKTKLNRDGTVTLDGKTPVAPEYLAEQDGLDLSTEALARMVESEAGILGYDGMLAVAFAALNHAHESNKDIAAILLKSKTGNGYFGRQDQGRYAATSKDPSGSAISAARGAIGGMFPDPTDGATQWDSPWSYKDPNRAEEVAAIRESEGKEKIVLSSIPERKLRFWRSV